MPHPSSARGFVHRCPFQDRQRLARERRRKARTHPATLRSAPLSAVMVSLRQRFDRRALPCHVEPFPLRGNVECKTPWDAEQRRVVIEAAELLPERHAPTNAERAMTVAA
jgi:hypothetical protein